MSLSFYTKYIKIYTTFKKWENQAHLASESVIMVKDANVRNVW